MIWAIFILGSYVIGSVPFGVLIGRMRGVDIRTQGSRNIGATNVGRLLGRPWGITCFGLDCLKGAFPVLAAGWHFTLLGRSPAELCAEQMWLWLAVATATVLGHMASIFLRFAGGKGVATSFGAIVAMWSLMTLPAVGALAVWYVTLRTTRYMSLASILAAISLPLWYLLRLIVPADDRSVGEVITHGAPPLIVTALLAALVVWRHRANIGRLRRGEETRVGGG